MLGLMVHDKLTNAGYFLFSSKEPAVLKNGSLCYRSKNKFFRY